MRKTIFAAIVAAAGLAAAPASADIFDDWDTDNDGLISEGEYTDALGPDDDFIDWDDDGDGMLSDNELNDGIYDRYDMNQDGYITRDEYDAVDLF